MAEQAASGIPDAWRQWIAENIMLGASPDILVQSLVSQGIPQNLAKQELTLAQSHPYVQAAKKVGANVKKRDWLLTSLEQLERLGPDKREIPRIQAPPRQAFIEGAYASNRPVVLTGAVEDWNAPKTWTTTLLRERVGHVEVKLQHHREKDPLHDINHLDHTTTQPLADLLHLMDNTGQSNDIYMTARNAESNKVGLGPLFDDFGQIAGDYLDISASNFCPFLWLGPAGIRTPLHHDLNNILFTQIFGQKRFTLFPPNQTPYLYNFHTVYSAVDPENPDYELYPDFAHAKPWTVTLNPGEVLFIPVGWWHHVASLTACASVGFVHLNMPNAFHHHYPKQA